MGPNTPLGISWTLSEERQLISATHLLLAVRSQQRVGVMPITGVSIAVVIITIMLQIHLMVTTKKSLETAVISA